MYHFLLEANEAGKQELKTFWEKFTLGGSVLLRGICTVFAVLCIIWLFLTIVRFFLYDLPRRREEQAAGKPQAAAVQSAAPQAAAPAAPAAPAVTDDGELIAVITAAIAAATAEQGGGKFRVVSFHRVNK